MAHITMALMALMENGSVEAKSGSFVVCPKICRREILDVSELVRNFSGCYAVKDLTLAFVCEGKVFVSPNTHKVREIMRDACFQQKNFYVPFSSEGEYPLEEERKWRILQDDMRQVQEMEFVKECEAFCEKVGIGKLSDEILKDCLEVPKQGIPFNREFEVSAQFFPVLGMMGVLPLETSEKQSKVFEGVYLPEIKIEESAFNLIIAHKLGKFYTNKGKIVFVYRNGKTYISKFYHVGKALEAAGYTEAPMFVPFANGEIITDPELKAKWDSLDRW